MSDRKDALTDMLAMVDARVGIQPEKRCYTEKFCSLFDRCFDEAMFDLFSAGYEGFLDAAKSLHEEVLPEWVVNTLDQASNLAGDPWGCEVAYFDGSDPSKNRKAYSGHDYSNPARAWLIAILKALIAQED